MAVFEEYADPRMASFYDAVNPFGADTAFYVELAGRLAPRAIIDIGCGTGLLADELARRGYDVTGIEPSSAMLEVARRRATGRTVHWVHGDATAARHASADLVLMTGHVAQVISDDDEWHTTLAAAHRALRPGGHLAFESRNPESQPWEAWTAEATRRRVRDVTLAGSGSETASVDVWYDRRRADGPLVHFEYHLSCIDSGEDLVSYNTLRFRTEKEITDALTDAGFTVEEVFGAWDRRPVAPEGRELIFVARRP
jgi:SAM-dependent methyltransferase